MKILVAGGAGYIGSMMVPALLERGYEVTVVDLLWFGNHLPSAAKVVKRDLMELEEKDLKGFDQVIFVAGLSNDPMAEFSPSKNFVGNGALPAYLAYLSWKAGVARFIHGGSCSVYGYTEDKLYDEESPTISNYPYGISKLIGEMAALKMQRDEFSVIALRQGTVSGFSPRMRMDLIVNTMFKSAVLDGKITVNNPTIWRPVLAIQDAVSAYVRAVEATASISGIFNVASGNYTVGEVADYVKHGVKEYLGLDVGMTINHQQDFRNYKVSIEKAKMLLSFKPRHQIEDIVHELAMHREEFGDFKNPNYYNIQILRKVLARDAAGLQKSGNSG